MLKFPFKAKVKYALTEISHYCSKKKSCSKNETKHIHTKKYLKTKNNLHFPEQKTVGYLNLT